MKLSQNDLNELNKLLQKAQSKHVKQILQNEIEHAVLQVSQQESAATPTDDMVTMVISVLPHVSFDEAYHALSLFNCQTEEAVDFLLCSESKTNVTPTSQDQNSRSQSTEDSTADNNKNSNTSDHVNIDLNGESIFSEKDQENIRKAEELEKEIQYQNELVGILARELAAIHRYMAKNRRSNFASQATPMNSMWNTFVKTKFYLPGESEAIKSGTDLKIYSFAPSYLFDLTPEHVHQRIAESQFYRPLLNSRHNIEVLNVEYCVNPALVRRFQKKRETLAQQHDFLVESMKPVLAFHGTAEENIMPICENNFKLSKVSSSTGDLGYYGRGIYFSESTSYTFSYCRGASKLLLCQVLSGRPKTLSSVQVGCARDEEYDSHMSPCGSELVIFDEDQILPTYIVHFKQGSSIHPQPVVFNNNNNNFNATNTDNNQFEHLSSAWDKIAQESKADKFMVDCQSFYQEVQDKQEAAEAERKGMNPLDVIYYQESQETEDEGEHGDDEQSKDMDSDDSEYVEVIEEVEVETSDDSDDNGNSEDEMLNDMDVNE